MVVVNVRFNYLPGSLQRVLLLQATIPLDIKKGRGFLSWARGECQPIFETMPPDGAIQSSTL